ncbi:MAG: hypothetical protein OEY14_02950, partial [Myxococcales bacterium]|nr:hypothetical protein [Myxococcales bacterium]
DEARRAELEKSLRAALLAAIGAKADEIHLWAVGSLPRTTSGKVRRAECARRVSTPANAAGELS